MARQMLLLCDYDKFNAKQNKKEEEKERENERD